MSSRSSWVTISPILVPAISSSGMLWLSTDGGTLWTVVGALTVSDAVAPPTPNPARSGGVLQLALSLATAGEVGLELCDVQGRVVHSRAAEGIETGRTVLPWRLPRLSSGVYFLRVTIRGESAVTRVVVLD